MLSQYAMPANSCQGLRQFDSNLSLQRRVGLVGLLGINSDCSRSKSRKLQPHCLSEAVHLKVNVHESAQNLDIVHTGMRITILSSSILSFGTSKDNVRGNVSHTVAMHTYTKEVARG
jgi:hypothetical protein